MSDAADKILATPRVEPARFQAMSPAEAVLRYRRFHSKLGRRDLDRSECPAVLVLILCVVHAATGAKGPRRSALNMTAGELVAACRWRGGRAGAARNADKNLSGRTESPARSPRPSRGRAGR